MTALDAQQVIRDRWRILVIATVLAAVAAYAYTRLPWVEQRWRSTVSMQATGRLEYGNFLALEKVLRPLSEQVRQLSIMREVDRNLHTDLSPEKMLERTRAEPAQDSGQIRVDVEDSDPRRAEQLSLEIADVYARAHNAEEQGKLREERVILTLLDRPNTAVLTWPQTRIIVPTAAFLGLIVSAAVVLGLAVLDDSLKTPDDIQQYLGLPVLGMLPRASAGASARRRRPRPTPLPEGVEARPPAAAGSH